MRRVLQQYCVDTVNRDEEGTMLIDTVDNNKSKLSALDLTQAKRARALQRRIGRPSICAYIHYVTTNMTPNLPITVQDIKSTEFSWGPDLVCVKGKTARQVSPKVRMKNTSMPVSIMQQYKNITMLVDIMKVASIPFLVTIYRLLECIFLPLLRALASALKWPQSDDTCG